MNICVEFIYWAYEHIMHTHVSTDLSAMLTALIHCCADYAQCRKKL